MGTKQSLFNRVLNAHGSTQDLGLHFIPKTFKLLRSIL
jgi:hypothetical protein